MARQNIIAIGAAIFIGLIAVVLANAFFSGMENRQAEITRQTRLTRIAVVTQPVEFGAPLSNANVAMRDWPAASAPPGAFHSFAEATANRVALRPLVPGEPVLAARVSGKNGRATIAANLPPDMVAVAIPVSEVGGVGGFVRPGDVVDVLLTRMIPGAGARGDDKMTDVIMQGVQVIAVDQTADSSKTDPAVGKTATVQVTTVGAQKLALARELGTISLALRNATDQFQGAYRTVTGRDLSHSGLYIRGQSTAPLSRPIAMAAPVQRRIVQPTAPSAPLSTGPRMTVYRKGAPTEYEVIHAR